MVFEGALQGLEVEHSLGPSSLGVQTPPLGVALIRVGVGALLLFEARRMLDAGVGPHLIEDCAHRIALAPELLARLGQDVLLRAPRAAAWAWVASTGLVGACWFVGAFVRPAALLLVAICALRWSFGPPSEQLAVALYALAAVGCALADAGRRLGLDATLARSLPAWLTWTGGKSSKRG